MKIGFDMGHTLSGLGTGAQSIVKETDVNRAIGNLVIKYLKEMGETVVNCTVDVSGNDLADRVAIANSNNVDLYVSLHLNAGGGVGTETYIYNGSYNGKEENRAKAKKVNDALVNLGFKNRGVKEANFYVIRETKAPAYLIELFFVDSQTDVNLYNSLGADKIARVLAEAICGKTIPNAPVVSESTLYRVVVGSYSERKNAEAQQAKLKEAGFNSFLDAFVKDGVSYLRVVAGTYANRENAEKVMSQLKSKGFSPFIAVINGTVTTAPTPAPSNPPVVEVKHDKELQRYEEKGKCTITASSIIFRDKPCTCHGVKQGQYNKNESVYYDLVVITEDYVWISWIGGSGARRYMPIKEKSSGERWGVCV